jgi:MBG domain (YGX type)
MANSMRLRGLAAAAVVALAVVALPLFGAGGAGGSDTPDAVNAAPLVSPSVPQPPFNICPAIGYDTGCAIVITLPATGPAIISQDSTQGTFDVNDDTLVGIVNDSGVAIPTVLLSSTHDIFHFDGDGICAGYGNWNGKANCPYGSTGYEGPGTSFSNYSGPGSNTGNVNFSNGGLAPGASTYFSLENSLSGADFTIPASFVVSKSVTSTGPYYAGNTSTPITYSISAHNIGGSAGDVTITDTVPTNTTLVTNSQACTSTPSGATCVPNAPSGNTLSWTVSNVPGGATVTVGFQVTPNALSSNYTVSNTGSWSGPGCSSESPCSTNPTSTDVIAPVPLTITASSATVTVGGTIPAITPSYSGLVNGDTAPTTPPTCSTTATNTSPAGTYTTSCSGAVDPKYLITYVDGTLTVTAAPVTSASTTATSVVTAAATSSTPSPTTAAASTTPAIAFTGAFLSQEWMIGLGALVLGTGLVLVARWRRRIPKHAAK